MSDSYRIDVEVRARAEGANAVAAQMTALSNSTRRAGRSAADATKAQKDNATALRSIRNQMKAGGATYSDFTRTTGLATAAQGRFGVATMSNATALRSIRNQVKGGHFLSDFTDSARLATEVQGRFGAATLSSATALRSIRNQMKGGHFLADFTDRARLAGGALTGLSSSAAVGEDALISLRYANYDLSRTMLTTAATIAAVGAVSLVAFAKQESAFTAVERILQTNGESVGNLEDALRDLSTSIPVSFADLSGIAEIGAALDIAADQLDDFSRVVAMASAVTGVATEEMATGIARIAQYTNLDDTAYGFEQIASAILSAGNISVATEPEVLRFAQSIALPGAQAGLAAEEIIGFAAATASFARINVEGAGSAYARVFNNIERAVDTGGEKLESFASIAGMTADEFRQAWANGGSGDAFRAVLAGLNQDLPNLNKNMDELSIRNIRDRRVVGALAQQWERVSVIMDQTAVAFGQNTSLSDAYALVLDDLSSVFQIFLNSVNNAAAALGEALAPSAVAALKAVTSVLEGFTEFASSDFGRVFIQVSAAIGGTVAAVTALRGALALATASSLAYRYATQNLGTGVGAQIGFLAKQWVAVGRGATVAGAQTTAATTRMTAGATAATAATTGLSGAMLRLRNTRVGTALSGVATSSTRMGAALRGAGTAMSGLRTVGSGLVGFLGGPWVAGITLAITAVVGTVSALSSHFAALEAQIQEGYRNALIEGASATGYLRDRMRELGFESVDLGDAYEVAVNGVGGFSREAGQSAGEIQEAARQTAALSGELETLGTTLATDMQSNLGRTQIAFQQLAEEFGLSGNAAAELIPYLGEDFVEALKGVATQADLSTDQMTLLNILMGGSKTYADLAEAGFTNLQGSMSEMQAQAEEAEQALSDLSEELDAIFDRVQSVSVEQDKLSAAFDNLVKAADPATASLEGTDEASRNLRAAMRELVEQGASTAEAILKTGGSSEDAKAKYLEARDALVNELVKRGFFEAEKAARKWVETNITSSEEVLDALHAVDEVVAIPEVNADPQEFWDKLSGVEGGLAGIDASKGTPKIGTDAGEFWSTNDSVNATLQYLDSVGVDPEIAMAPGPFWHSNAEVNEALRYLNSVWVDPTASMDNSPFWRMFNNTNDGLSYLDRLDVRPDANLEGDAYAEVWSTLTWLRDIARTWTANLTVNRHFNDYYDGGGGGRWAHPSVSGRFDSGGYTGRGGRLEPAGIVHRGEYVIPKHMVNQATGLPFADALGKLTRGVETGIGYARGGFVRPAPAPMSGPIDLSESSLRRLARLIPQEIVVSGQRIASVTNQANTQATSRGAR